MLRSSRMLRRLLATAVTTGALLVLPGAAMAAGDFTVAINDPADVPAGTVITHTATVTNVDAAESDYAETVEFDIDSGAGDVTGVALGTNGTDVAVVCDTPSKSCAIPMGVDAGASFTVTVSTTTGRYFDAWGELYAWFDTDGSSAYRDFTTIANGGPSSLKVTIVEPTAGIAKDTTADIVVTVRNSGATANFVRMSSYIDDWDRRELFSPTPPAFNPVRTILAGGECVVLSSSSCEFASIPAGATKSYTIRLSGLTHYSDVWIEAGLNGKADIGADVDNADYARVQVTTPESNLVKVDVADVVAASGGAPVVWNGELVNGGPSAITNGVLELVGTAFDAQGFSTSSSDPASVASIQSIVLSNGATCARKVDGMTTYKDVYHCPLASLAAGARVTFAVTASHATTRTNQNASISATMHTSGFHVAGSHVEAYDSVRLNPAEWVDLQVSVASTGAIGADRLNPVTVAVKNAGNVAAEFVSVNGDLLGVGGEFDKATMPATCTGVTKPQYAECALGTIEPGATATLTINVRGGAKLGDLVATFSASSGGPFELNHDDNTIVQVLEVKKASLVPFTGVVFAKPAKQTIGKVVKNGVPANVTCPNACKVKGELQVNRALAMKLGLIKKAKGKAAAKPLVIGTITKTDADGGKVTISIKLTKAYKAKVAKLRKALTVSRVITVTSTAAGTKDASVKKAQNVTFKPGK